MAKVIIRRADLCSHSGNKQRCPGRDALGESRDAELAGFQDLQFFRESRSIKFLQDAPHQRLAAPESKADNAVFCLDPVIPRKEVAC